MQIAASSLMQVGPYNPRAKAAQIACPLLIVLPVEDNLTPPAGAWEIAKAVPEKCELVELQCKCSPLPSGVPMDSQFTRSFA